MNSLEILRALALIPEHTIGVYPSDMIPETWQIPAALVFNTDNSKKPGTHWVAAYVDRDSSGYYFDSYGIRPYTVEPGLTESIGGVGRPDNGISG